MSKNKGWKYVYGPVSSWRLGRSLGIDLLSQAKKVCNFNCIYCQLGETAILQAKRKVYAPTDEVIKELTLFPKVKIDYITFSGSGEPTLAKNLGEVIRAVKKLRREPVAVLTNSLLIYKETVRKELMQADFVIAKLDNSSEGLFQSVNRPGPGAGYKDILRGLERFRREYKKRLAIQIMFIEENKTEARELARLCRRIQPDEVELNTPLRPCPCRPLSKKELLDIKKHFKGLRTISVYDIKRKNVAPINAKDTRMRSGEP